jgi:ubiquinone biosynthesis protein Coq4
VRLAKAMKILKYYVVSLYGAYRLTKDQKDGKYLYYITDTQDQIDEMYREKDPAYKSFQTEAMEGLWKERYFPPTYDLDALEKLAPNTLGHIYAKHMKRHGLTPDFYIKFRNLTEAESREFFNSRIKYIRFRISQTHDIWHVVSGFDVSALGEAGLQGFYFGQFHSGFSIFIYLISLVACLSARQYDSMEKSVELFHEGYLNGKRAQFLLPVKWEEHWGEDIDEVRAKYGIRAVVHDAEEMARLSRKRHSVLAPS